MKYNHSCSSLISNHLDTLATNGVKYRSLATTLNRPYGSMKKRREKKPLMTVENIRHSEMRVIQCRQYWPVTKNHIFIEKTSAQNRKSHVNCHALVIKNFLSNYKNRQHCLIV
uniref:Uncharacterized protein n=1 Tax=Cacopsylla melanoneura TaxID=428564 RepID=A0A8D9F3G6_9HEMI